MFPKYVFVLTTLSHLSYPHNISLGIVTWIIHHPSPLLHPPSKSLQEDEEEMALSRINLKFPVVLAKLFSLAYPLVLSHVIHCNSTPSNSAPQSASQTDNVLTHLIATPLPWQPRSHSNHRLHHNPPICARCYQPVPSPSWLRYFAIRDTHPLDIS